MASRLREAAAYRDAAVITGLMTDEVSVAHTDSWPSEVTEALERLGLYDKYSPTSIHGVLRVMSKSQIAGLVNSVKGTAFEQMSVADLNAGVLGPLPDGGDHVVLAESLNQPGWDAEALRTALQSTTYR